jgi:GT2 family glycosyltransferase
VGLLDEHFYPIYYEDLDFSVRFRQAGWKMLMAPQAKLWHKVSLTNQGSDSPNERYLMARMSVRYYRKHVRNLAWCVVIPWRMGSAIKTSLRLLAHQKIAPLNAYWRGLLDGLRDP